MELRQRRVVSRFVRLALIALAIGIGIFWLRDDDEPKVKARTFDMTSTATATHLGPGDVQIFNVDSSVDIILAGTKINAGLSPRVVAKVRGELAKETEKDTSGFGGAIAQLVKEQVADKIGTRVVYDIDAIQDIHYRDPSIVIEWKHGGEERLFGSVKVDGDKNTNRFRREEAERFIAAVKARQRSGTF
jgi:hypothetical protein